MEERETLGYFEEFVAVSGKTLGLKVTGSNPEPRRALGSAGRRQVALTSPVELQKGFKTVVVRASSARPVHCYTTLYPLEGKTRNQ